MYANGRDVVQDDAKAMHWFKLAAEQGHGEAMRGIGLLYSNGRGVAKDQVLAHMWFSLAAAQGDVLAGTWRDAIAGEMTTEELARSEERARVCDREGWRDCG
jgi:TPR repeat protein